MDTTPLYNLAPVLQLMAVGLLVAGGPLLWLRWRHREATPVRRLQALTVLTLFLTFDLVLFGAFTRLTDSGLGCPDWPGCYGHASPAAAHAHIEAAQDAQPSGPVTHSKAWVEMVHRYLATAVGVLILALTVLSVRLARRREGVLPVRPFWPAVTLVWVCIQGAFGALTVTMKLFPAIVTLHLAGGLVLLALLCAQAVRHKQSADGVGPVLVSDAQRWVFWGALVLLSLQVLLGGWVSTNYAVLACAEFPGCQGVWWPSMDWRAAMEVWRPLGLTAAGEPLSFQALTAIHMAHRMLACVTALALLGLAWALLRSDSLRKPARWLGALLTLQIATGLSNVVLGWPLLAAVMHTGGAGALVMVLVWVLVICRQTRSLEVEKETLV